MASQRYTLSADALQSDAVKLNGRAVVMAGDELPSLPAENVRAGAVALRPATITFFAIPGAANPACH